MRTVRQAVMWEAGPISELVARAFYDDPISRWCLACTEYREVLELEFLEAARQTIPRGWLWVAGALEGVAAWIPPGTGYNDDAIDAVVHPVLAGYGGDPERAAAFWAWVDSHRPREPYWYLDFVAVEPVHHRTGCGSLLLRWGLEQVDADGAAAFLLTANPLTVPWYERHGFEIREQEQAPSAGPMVWFMVRPHPT